MLNQQPFISVIIINYNYERFLADAIHSALKQNYAHKEIIVVDDASTDNSRELILSYGDKIIPILLEKNLGQGGGFNAGFLASRGDIICFLDADDIFLENKLTLLAQAAEKKPNALCFYHQGYLVDKYLNARGQPFPLELPQGNLRNRLLRTGATSLPPTSFLAFRRTYLEKILPLEPFLTRIDADSPLQMLAVLLGEIVAIPQPLTFYRVHGDNWFSNKDYQKYDLDTLQTFMRRTEKVYYYVNKKLAALNLEDRMELANQPDYFRNLFIFHSLPWWRFFLFSFFSPKLKKISQRWRFFKWGLERHKQYALRLQAG